MAPSAQSDDRRRATLAAFFALLAAAASPAGAQTAGCRPIPNVGPREATSYHDPQPDAALVQAVARLKAADPSVHVRFSQCEVDSFTARPKPTVPPYAVAILQNAGLPTDPAPIELLPKPIQDPKAGQDLDSPSLRVRKVPAAEEAPLATLPDSDAQPSDGAANDPRPGTPVVESRTEPAIVLEPRVSPFVPPPPAVLEAERTVAKPILAAFLARHDDVFRMGSGELDAGLPGLKLAGYRIGRFGRTVTFTQQVRNVPVLESRTQVMFDGNWNVIVVSRTLYTPAKLSVLSARTIPAAAAVGAAKQAVAQLTGRDPASLVEVSAVRGLDALRRQRVWQVRIAAQSTPDVDYTVLVGRRAEVLNVSDNVQRFTDAKTRRWAYVSGDQTQPYQVTSTGIYTRGSNTLRHDFFYLETDERGGGTLGQFQCTADSWSDKSLWRQFAWGTTNSASSYIRHTHRSDRDFSIWSPAHSSGSFGESHTYFWARQFYQWMKPALNELGVLPGNAADFPKTTVIANSCIDDVGIASSSLDVTIHLNEGESEGKVRLADLCRQGNVQCAANDYDDAANSFITCEGGGCHPTPSVVQHELNHRILGGMFGVSSGLDCGASDQRTFLHEGLLGSVLPQAFWHYWYGVGFNPATDRLFTADAVRGRVHANLASNLVRSDYPCSGADDYSQGPYEAGRVAGQPLWEIFHGKRVSGNSVFNTWRPATDTDFLILSYWAADLMASSTYRDRWEFANRVMEILEISGWPSDVKQDYCEIFAHHELDDFIDASYCS
jgi:hypothetical protein